MSSSIAIPTTPALAAHMEIDHRRHQSSKGPSGSSSSSYSCSPTPNTPESGKATPVSTPTQKQKMPHQRRPSLLSSAISKQESTTINISDDPEGPPRLISYLSSSQGFAWNPEIFLPSSIDYDYIPLENRHEPVHEIFLSDDEIKKMLPQ